MGGFGSGRTSGFGRDKVENCRSIDVNRLHRKGGLHAGWSGGWQWSRDGEMPRLRLEIVKRSDDIKGFVVFPRRWVVERTFSWFGRNRRLASDFENLAETLATFVTLASIQLALRRLARA